ARPPAAGSVPGSRPPPQRDCARSSPRLTNASGSAHEPTVADVAAVTLADGHGPAVNAVSGSGCGCGVIRGAVLLRMVAPPGAALRSKLLTPQDHHATMLSRARFTVTIRFGHPTPNHRLGCVARRHHHGRPDSAQPEAVHRRHPALWRPSRRPRRLE